MRIQLAEYGGGLGFDLARYGAGGKIYYGNTCLQTIEDVGALIIAADEHIFRAIACLDAGNFGSGNQIYNGGAVGTAVRGYGNLTITGYCNDVRPVTGVSLILSVNSFCLASSTPMASSPLRAT